MNVNIKDHEDQAKKVFSDSQRKNIILLTILLLFPGLIGMNLHFFFPGVKLVIIAGTSMGLMATAIWLILFIRKYIVARQLIAHTPELLDKFNDEFHQYLSQKSFKISYIVNGLFHVLLLFIVVITALSARNVMIISLMSLFMTPAIVMLFLLRD